MLIRGGRVKDLAGRALSHPARRARHPGRQGPQAAPLEIRRETTEVRREEDHVPPPPRRKTRSSSRSEFEIIVVTKFMNSIMYDGKKSVAEQIVYGALDFVQTKTKQAPLGVPPALGNVAAVDRSALAPRRRRHLPGAGRSSHRAPPGAGHPLVISPRAAATKRP